jgi:hypothetical protein
MFQATKQHRWKTQQDVRISITTVGRTGNQVKQLNKTAHFLFWAKAKGSQSVRMITPSRDENHEFMKPYLQVLRMVWFLDAKQTHHFGKMNMPL